MLTLEERIDRLEKRYEETYHTIELLSIYIPRLTDILIKYWGASGRHRGAVIRDLGVMKNAIEEHFKTHYIDKKKKEEYASKRKTLDTNKLSILYKATEDGNEKP